MRGVSSLIAFLRPRPFLSVSVFVAATLAIALLAFYVLNATESIAALLFMLWALVAGAFGTKWGAVAASFMAALCLDFWFISPIFKITIGSPRGWISLFAFLAASLLASSFSSALRRQRDELAQRQSEAERLHALSRALLLTDRTDDMRRLLVNKCMELFSLEEAVLFEVASGGFWRSSSKGTVRLDDLRRAAIYSSPQSLEDGTYVIPVMLGNKVFGSLGYRGEELDQSVANSLSNTLATGLAQAQAHEAGNQADAIRRSEELKSVMIDALAHDLKTPLTAIEMAAETLIHTPSLAHQQTTALLNEIWQAAQGLHQLVHQAIHLSRIDAKRLRLETIPLSSAEVIQTVVQSFGERADSHVLVVDIQPGMPSVLADPELLNQALKQLVDNALRYSPMHSVITITAAHVDGSISISVRDQGQGLTELEQSRVFEKFYRGRQNESPTHGSGMGLAIAKEIAEAHGGAVNVESQLGRGTRFTITLKAANMEKPA